VYNKQMKSCSYNTDIRQDKIQATNFYIIQKETCKMYNKYRTVINICMSNKTATCANRNPGNFEEKNRNIYRDVSHHCTLTLIK
jgi:hypothetical protein